jgi:hypothetical protein
MTKIQRAWLRGLHQMREGGMESMQKKMILTFLDEK